MLLSNVFECQTSEFISMCCILKLISKTIRGNIRLEHEQPRRVSGEVDDVEDSSHLSAIVSADRDAIASSQV